VVPQKPYSEMIKMRDTPLKSNHALEELCELDTATTIKRDIKGGLKKIGKSLAFAIPFVLGHYELDLNLPDAVNHTLNILLPNTPRGLNPFEFTVGAAFFTGTYTSFVASLYHGLDGVTSLVKPVSTAFRKGLDKIGFKRENSFRHGVEKMIESFGFGLLAVELKYNLDVTTTDLLNLKNYDDFGVIEYVAPLVLAGTSVLLALEGAKSILRPGIEAMTERKHSVYFRNDRFIDNPTSVSDRVFGNPVVPIEDLEGMDLKQLLRVHYIFGEPHLPRFFRRNFYFVNGADVDVDTRYWTSTSYETTHHSETSSSTQEVTNHHEETTIGARFNGKGMHCWEFGRGWGYGGVEDDNQFVVLKPSRFARFFGGSYNLIEKGVNLLREEETNDGDNSEVGVVIIKGYGPTVFEK
jgi:hypothetical protein